MSRLVDRLGTALVAWAAALMVLAGLPLGAAGTVDDPDITDAAGDQTDFALGLVPLSGPVGQAGDVISGWVEEDSFNLTFVARVNGELEGVLGGSGFAGEGIVSDYSFRFSVTSQGITKDLATTYDVDGTHPDAGLSASVTGDQMRLVAPRTLLGITDYGVDLTFSIFVACRGTGLGSPLEIITGIQTLFTDRAPDSGTGRNYTTQFGLGGVPGDVDGDGLNDTYEMEHFGDLQTANATGDNDGDGLNNSAEAETGTDPTLYDTDGDTLNDLEDPFPLDGTQPADFDEDGLNDSWERSYYNDIATYDGMDDPDRDNRTNAQEEADGTNPLKGDTDGDGVRDDLDFAPLDAAVSQDPDAAPMDAGASAAKPELYAGVGLFAAAATFCLLGLARFL